MKRVRERTGSEFIIIYRLSMIDLVQGGSTWDEVDYQPIMADTWYANRVIRSFKHYKRGPGPVEKLLWEARKYNVPDAVLGTRFGLNSHDSGVILSCAGIRTHRAVAL